MSNHTAGPWVVDVHGMVATKAVGAEGWEICDIRADVPECDANAHLIAAAPDLLEALQDALLWVDGSTKVKVKAAIAKATGSDGDE